VSFDREAWGGFENALPPDQGIGVYSRILEKPPDF
jgi:hypothetical protein